jgi:hypothetical protein
MSRITYVLEGLRSGEKEGVRVPAFKAAGTNIGFKVVAGS